ncbi:Transcriptional enhancer factor TEF-3 [Mactra antiquata]
MYKYESNLCCNNKFKFRNNCLHNNSYIDGQPCTILPFVPHIMSTQSWGNLDPASVPNNNNNGISKQEPGYMSKSWENMDAPPPAPNNGQTVPPQPKTENDDDLNDDELGNDAEGVWSPDIEQSFQEALAIYPPCGRRKIILSDEGKMYGRNELIARYIKLRTGKTRSRKQVSSHIQVLARRKTKEVQASFKFWQHPNSQGDVKPPYGAPGYGLDTKPPTSMSSDMTPSWQGRSIAGPKLRLVEFSAYLEQQRDGDQYHKHLFVHINSNAGYADPLLEAVDIRQIYDKFPEKKGGLKELYDKGPQPAFFLVKFWADINTNVQDEQGAFYGVNSQYESSENMTITCSTKVCSFGKQVVEKVETEYPRFENGRFVYRIHRSPMCEYMINFIHKLKHLPEKYMMNSVLENFTILQVVSNRETQETLLCIAYVFEVSTSEHGAQHHIYKLVKD